MKLKLKLKNIQTKQSVIDGTSIFRYYRDLYHTEKETYPVYLNGLTELVSTSIDWVSNNSCKNISAQFKYILEYAYDEYTESDKPDTFNDYIETINEYGYLHPIAILQRAYELLAGIVYNKFSFKWDKLWSAFNAEYNPISNYNIDETERFNTDKTTKKNTDLTIKQNTNQTNNTDNSTFAFNSSTAVPKDKSSVTLTGDADNNYNHSIGEADDNYEQVIGDAEDNYRTLEKSGNIGIRSNQELLEQEFELRKKLFYQMIFEDVNSVLLNNIYD